MIVIANIVFKVSERKRQEQVTRQDKRRTSIVTSIECKSGLNEAVRNAKQPIKTTQIIKKCELPLKQKKQENNWYSRQACRNLKKFKESTEFFNYVKLSRSNIYFKIRLYKFLTKFPVLTN